MPDERLYRDTIKVPAVMQLAGEPFPTEFYARYPEAFRVPVRIVWRDRPSDPDAAPPPPTQAAPSPPSAGAAGRTEAPADEASATDATAPVAAPGGGYGRADPVGTYMRVNDFPDRLLGRAAPAPDGPRTQDPSTPIPFFDDRDQSVIGPDGKQMMRPAKFDPHFFVQQGLMDREIMKGMQQNTDDAGTAASLGYLAGRLSNSRQGGNWDTQRIGGSYHDEFVNFATVAIGLYSAAAGIPLEENLAIQDFYASHRSNFGTKPHDQTYTHVLSANVDNTKHGYLLYNLGLFSANSK